MLSYASPKNYIHQITIRFNNTQLVINPEQIGEKLELQELFSKVSTYIDEIDVTLMHGFEGDLSFYKSYIPANIFGLFSFGLPHIFPVPAQTLIAQLPK